MANSLGSVNNFKPIGGASEIAKPSVGSLSRSNPTDKADFRNALDALQRETTNKATGASVATGLKFSNHAIERMQSRGISFSPEQMNKIAGAVEKAASKGSKNALLLSDTSAMIVSIKDQTVVTVLDRAAMKDNVFTNIDSTVMI